MAFTAKYRGKCRDCDDPINVGDWVEFDDDRNLLHQVCPVDRGLDNKPRRTCEYCFMIMPSGGQPCECRD